jgi:hypothetical protein
MITFTTVVKTTQQLRSSKNDVKVRLLLLRRFYLSNSYVSPILHDCGIKCALRNLEALAKRQRDFADSCMILKRDT